MLNGHLLSIKMNKLILIGAGNIGSRHLQGLRLVQSVLDITVVDPSDEALGRAQELFKKVDADHEFEGKLYFTNEIPANQSFVIAIVATSSGVRRAITEQLLNTNEIKYLVLEKFLFQTLEDYSAIANLLEERQVTAFVNCPRRLFPFYRELRNELQLEKGPVEFHFSGTNWGLACNSVHRLDLFAFLTSDTELEIDVSGLEQTIVSSKRKGYVEFHGRIECNTRVGDKMIVTSFSEGSAPNLQIINTPSRRYIISEKQRFMFTADAQNNWEWLRQDFEMPFQSQLTNVFVEELLSEMKCSLTPYAESSLYHTALLNGFMGHISNASGEKVTRCPIT